MKNYGDFIKDGKIPLGAHRGDFKYYPENTMPAFISAYKLGVDNIETDVRRTKDGVLVLIHDRSVERTTGAQGFVDQMTLAEIKALDAGIYKGEEFKGEQIPTVEEFLDFISTTDLVINWELKEYPSDLGDRAYETADELVKLIRKYGLSKRSLINTFSQKLIEYFYNKYPGEFVLHGYIGYDRHDTAETPLEVTSDWTAIWRKDEDHLCGFEEDYAFAKEHGVKACILVPDTVENYAKAIEMGCEMFTTNDIKTAIDCLKKLGKR